MSENLPIYETYKPYSGEQGPFILLTAEMGKIISANDITRPTLRNIIKQKKIYIISS